jgi:hypothetical protein
MPFDSTARFARCYSFLIIGQPIEQYVLPLTIWLFTFAQERLMVHKLLAMSVIKLIMASLHLIVPAEML